MQQMQQMQQVRQSGFLDAAALLRGGFGSPSALHPRLSE
jgi:hypothetical protein